MPSPSPPRTTILYVLGGLELALLIGFGWLESVPLPLPRLLWPLGALLCYGAAAWYSMRADGPEWASAIPAIWILALLMRVALLPLSPELSDDLYRYLWDGHVQTSGINPYLYAPAHEALAALRTSWHGLINNPTVPTIYPPLTQLVFALVAFASTLTSGASILTAKVTWVIFDLGAAFLLGRAAQVSGRPVRTVLLLYLWSPLLVVESAWSGHFDPVGLFWIAALLLAAARVQTGTGGLRLGALLGAAALTKLAPAAALPAVMRSHGWKAALSFGVLCLVFYAPYAWIGIGPLTEGLRTYSEHWTANEGAFWIIHSLVRNPFMARGIAGAVVVGVILLVTLKKAPVDQALLWILGTGLLMSPTVHPWYALWVLPMAALRSHIPFLLLSGLVFLGYWGLASYQTTGVWPQPGWARALMWLPVWSALLFQAAHGWNHRRTQPSAKSKS